MELTKNGKTVYFQEIGRNAYYREFIFAAVLIARHWDKFGDGQIVEARYIPEVDVWVDLGLEEEDIGPDHNRHFGSPVKLEGSGSREALEELGVTVTLDRGNE